MLLLVFAGCQSEARAYAEALQAVREAPAEAARLCAGQPRDCTWLAVELLAPTDPEAALALCGEMDNECRFLVAEGADDPRICAQTGIYANQCRRHLFTRAIAPPRRMPVEEALRWVGLPADDERARLSAWREVAGAHLPMDLSVCEAAEDAALCRKAHLLVFSEMLDHWKGHSSVDLCHELPERLRFVPHPELEALLARRRVPGDLCP